MAQQFERTQQQIFFRAKIFFQRGSLRQNRPQLWSQVQRCPRLATPFSGLHLPYNICLGTQGRGLDPCHGGFWSSTDMDLMLLSSWSEATWHAASDGLRPQHLDQSRKQGEETQPPSSLQPSCQRWMCMVSWSMLDPCGLSDISETAIQPSAEDIWFLHSHQTVQ